MRPGGRGLLPVCPACGEGGGNTPRMFAAESGMRWACHRCMSGGDSIDLAAYSLTGARLPRGRSTASEHVQSWFAGRGWCEPVNGIDTPATPAPRTPTVKPQRTRGRLPHRDVAEFAGRCVGVTERADVTAWLVRRLGVHASMVERYGLARALGAPPSQQWARIGSRDWHTAGYRVVLPCVDPGGSLVGFRARHVGGARIKNAVPRGHAAGGMVLANPAARAWLRGAMTPGLILIAEGGPAWLALAICNPDRPVVGIYSGAWSESFARRIPAGCVVRMAPDPDDAGAAYFDRIAATVPGLVLWALPVQADEVLLTHGPRRLTLR